MANNDTKKLTSLPKLPSMFGKKGPSFGPGAPDAGRNISGKGFAPQIRITQSKGAGGK